MTQVTLCWQGKGLLISRGKRMYWRVAVISFVGGECIASCFHEPCNGRGKACTFDKSIRRVARPEMQAGERM